MLSAIAVRRARGLDTVQQDPLDPSPSTPSPPLLRQDMPPSTLASKRKPKSQGGNSSRKRKKEIKDVEEKRTRYFDVQDAFEREEDLVVIDQDGDGDDSDSDEEIYQPEHVLPPKTAGSKKITERRAWSPSVPLNDSSDQGSEQGEEGPDILEDLVITTRTVSDPEHVALSTFQPVIDQNTFHLSPAEARSLEFLRNSESITILALAPAETITLLGTYALTIVYGSISLSGVGLNASSTSHRVFAPRSSPVPVLRCLSAGSGTVPDPSTLTERLRNLFAREVAVIALQETRTGVEGLGRVCRTFNGVFEPSRWQRSNGEPQLGLSSIHVACISSRVELSCAKPPS